MVDTRPAWMIRAEPLFQHMRNIGARMTWEAYASLNPDLPYKRDVLVQHWYVPDGPKTRYYISYIWADGAGWNIFREVDPGHNRIEETLKEII